MSQEARAALAAFKALPQSQWRDIETAPKDDDSILLCAIGADKRPMIVIGRWECGKHAHLSRRICPASDCDFRWLGEMGTHYGVPFTHWMPLPDPPASADDTQPEAKPEGPGVVSPQSDELRSDGCPDTR